MKNILYITTLIFSSVLLQNCTEKEPNKIPVISLVSMTPTTVHQYTDSVIIIIHYQDKDGDIGIPDADKNSLWIQDARLVNPDEYFISPLAPIDTEVSIEGEFRIKLKNTFKLGTAAQEITKFNIWLFDRAGNKSNILETPELTITD